MDGIIEERIPVNRFFKRRVKFHFGMYVWIAIAEKHDVWLDELDKIDENELGVDALTFAAQWAEYMDGRKRFVTHDKMKRWSELIPVKQMNRIQKCMLDSRMGGEHIMKLAERSKKKQVPKNSKTSR